MRTLPAILMWTLPAVFGSLIPASSLAAPLALDERPAGDGEWGYRPASGAVSATTPPSFSWRPQKGIVAWELECGRGDGFQAIQYRAEGLTFNVHCPPKVFAPGTYTWRYRGVDREGNKTNWSQSRTLTIPAGAVAMPMPPRAELLARIPKTHPRMFIRPEDLPRLRELARGPLKAQFDRLVADCEKLVASPPPTAEPEKYPPGLAVGGEAWRKIWWGNRMYTIRALDGAATLGFTRLLGGKEEYGRLARRILLDCAKWDPVGATGYRYNDEAGMPYASRFARTYSFVHDLLSEAERAECRRVMKVRGEEMYRHLCPRHLWQPYSSHSNRAWHFLGEVGVSFLDEIEGADDWVWFAMSVFYNVYPVWCDDDGGWHEGVSYWSSYIDRFTWWADIMRSAMGINAFDKPYFSKAGYWPMYLLPPGKRGGGFGDGASRMAARQVVPLVSQLAAQSGNGHWEWYVQQMGGPTPTGGYVGFVRGTLPKVEARTPDDLPPSRLFRGVGQAALNTTLLRADEDVQVIFKSSPMGTQSHGNEANNSFVLWAYGEPLLLRTGHYYSYGDPHHRGWVWSTRSLCNITVDGHDQAPARSAETKGEIVDFQTTASIDAVVGEAGQAYRLIEKGGRRRQLLDRYTRTILLVKPDLVVVYDRLVARDPAVFQYWLHAANEFKVDGQRKIEARAGDVALSIDFLAPEGLSFAQTNQYDPNPEPQITAREWHLTATTPARSKSVEFVAVYRVRRVGRGASPSLSGPGSGAGGEGTLRADLKPLPGGYLLTAALADGRVLALLPSDDSAGLSAAGLTTQGTILVQRYRGDSIVQTLKVRQSSNER